MKLNSLLLISVLLHLAFSAPISSTEAEEDFREIKRDDPKTIPEFLNKRITVNFNATDIADALAIIASEGNFHINYNRSHLSLNKLISGIKIDEKAIDVLLFVLKDANFLLLSGQENSLIIKPYPKFRKETGSIRGRVFDSETGFPLIGTNIVLLGKGLGGSTDENGHYFIPDIPAGKYTMEYSYIGYEDKQFEPVEVTPEKEVVIDVGLIPSPLQLKEIVITPGKFAVMGREPIIRQTLTEQNLQTIPFGEDIYRAITRLPGVTASDFSTKFMIRGGKNEEVLSLLDGLELYEPFHLKDVEGGLLSIVDDRTIEGIDLYTGGFPAEYGEYMSGVFQMKSASPARGQSRTSLGISFMNARFMSEGRFLQNKGSWVVSARRGYLDLVLKLMDEQDPPLPRYYDIFTKVAYQLGKKHSLSANLIHSHDKLDFNEQETSDVFDTKYGNSYGWLTLNSMFNPRLLIQTTVSLGMITHHRRGIGHFDDTGLTQFTVEDQNQVDDFTLKQAWDLELTNQWFLKWGFYYNYQRADYNYVNTITRQNLTGVDTSSVYLNPAGGRFGGYLSNRFRIFSPFTVELGVRYDHNRFTDDQYVSPRVNFVYAFGKQTCLRAGWGHFNQSQKMHEIKVAYGERDFFTAQKSTHWVLGLEHTRGNGLNLRLEAYYKKITQHRPDYRIFTGDIEVFPEVQEDDLFALTFDGARSRGVESYLKYDKGGKFSFWASYALAYSDEDVRSFTYQKEITILNDPQIPNPYDQRHTIYLDFNYRPNHKWHLNVTWQYHSGWPYTRRIILGEQLPDGGILYNIEYEELYNSRLPAYHRLDVQLSRHVYLSGSQITLFVALINLYNRDNIRNIKYSTRTDQNGIPYLVEQKGYWFPLLPSLGVTWTWGH
jgi:hypothetical protein